MTTKYHNGYKEEITVLDHGYVKYIDHMGSDHSIVEDARMSTGRGFVSWEPYVRCKPCERVILDEAGSVMAALAPGGAGMTCACGASDWEKFPRGDAGFLERLVRERHTTPIETGGHLKVEVQAPLVVFREWHRHRTQAYNEFSARYAQMPNLHYVPSLERMKAAAQSKTNKQGSQDGLDEGLATAFCDDLREEQELIYETYENACDHGIAKEVARLNTPVSRYSKMRASASLWNWFHFLGLRMAPGAQWEIRQYADAVAQIVKARWPRAFALFEEHQLHAVRLSRTEADALLRYFKNDQGTADLELMAALVKRLEARK